MSIIDRKRPEDKHIPATLDGEVLLEETKDADGRTTGFHTIKAEYLKHYADTRSDEELAELGFGKYMDKVALVKERSDIVGKILGVTAG